MFELPERLKKTLSKNRESVAKIDSLLVDFGSWIGRNELYFFPEYTDHGPTHLEQVLDSIDSLVSDDSWQHFTEQDVVACVTATVLHDSAMHMTWSGFSSLISDTFISPGSKFTSPEKPWSHVWEEFFQTATRFDARTLKRIFGDESVQVERPPKNEILVNEFHRRLIGEFLRRNHARLAHEIALTYVPGSDPKLTIPDFDDELKDLFGFIARSHNMQLRRAADKIESARRQTYLGVHAPYCMALLRVADFIQVHSARAPSAALRVRELISPLSRAEWAKHDAIKFIDSNHIDPESIYIDADPKHPEVLNALRSLFGDIQHEVDQSWSVLGEVYGGHNSLRSLGLTLRRIRSSIDDLDAFIKERRPSFVPGDFRFRTSEAEMLKLLVEPLYGRNPAIGIRELIQNAVDATKERWAIDPNLFAQNELPPPVLVELFGDREKEKYSLIISDSGVGMTIEILDNYFLNIGASFRTSDYWKRTFDTKTVGNVGRTGRFGVGVLAGYLLGRRLEVVTRHWSCARDTALKFGCEIESEDLRLEYASSDVGTSIKVELTKDVYETLTTVELYSSKELYEDWDWYVGARPAVRRFLNGEELKQGFEVSEESALWHKIVPEGFDKVLWTYGKNGTQTGKLFCNNIFVTSHYSRGDTPLDVSPRSPAFRNEDPSIAVFDSSANLPLTLQRNALATDSLPFEAEILEDLGVYFAEEIKKIQTDIISDPGKNFKNLFAYSIPGFVSRMSSHSYVALFFVAKDRIIPADKNLFFLFRPRVVVVLAITEFSQELEVLQSSLKPDELLLIVKVRSEKWPRSNWLRKYFLCDRIDWFLGRCVLSYSLLITSTKMVSGLVQSQYVPPTYFNDSVDLTTQAQHQYKFNKIEVARLKDFSPGSEAEQVAIIARDKILAMNGVEAVADIGINWDATDTDFFNETPLARSWKIISSEANAPL